MSRALLSIVAIALVSVQNRSMSTSAPRTARARARAELTAEITETARRHLAESGAAGLSLRAIARDLGIVSSAVYRYFPSRDDLLTALIVDAYDAVGTAAEAADSSRRRSDFGGRWLATVHAVRSWAVEHPHEYALVYGSPVPGYRAPDATIDPAARVALVMLRLLADAAAAGRVVESDLPPMPRPVRDELAQLADGIGLAIPEPTLAVGVGIWTEMFGLISFQLFGHLRNGIDDDEAFFDHQMRAAGRRVFA